MHRELRKRVLRVKSLLQENTRNAGSAGIKNPKLELTMRTPYRTIFENFNAFTRVYVQASDGLIAIGNNTFPRVYGLMPGSVSLKGVQRDSGNFAQNESGEFIHAGGWVFVHDNNSVDINLIECVEKEEFSFDKVDSTLIETSDPTKMSAVYERKLQEQAIRLTQRRK